MSKKAKSKVVRKAEESKSEIIRRHYDSGYSVKEIKEMTGCSDSLIRIVIRNLNKKREKNSAKEGKARFNSPRSRLINDLFQVKKAMDKIEEESSVAKVLGEKVKVGTTIGGLTLIETAPKTYRWIRKDLVDEKATSDLVNHPPHYKSGGIETIDFIEAKDLNYRLGNVVKYVARAGKKATDPVQDLEKALWYLQREINARKKA